MRSRVPVFTLSLFVNKALSQLLSGTLSAERFRHKPHSRPSINSSTEFTLDAQQMLTSLLLFS